jgi:hypothetical protein
MPVASGGIGATIRKFEASCGACSDTNATWLASGWNGNSLARPLIPALVAVNLPTPIARLLTLDLSMIGEPGSLARIPPVVGMALETMPPPSTLPALG